MEISKDLILLCLEELKRNQSSKLIYKDYYEGNHSILKDFKIQDGRSNIKLVFSFPRKFIDTETGYLLGKPVNYVSKSDNDKVTKVIDFHLSHWDKEHNLNIRKQSEIYGESYELNYVNSDGEFSATILTPMNCYVLEDGTAERNPLMAVHKYSHKFDDREYVDIYLPDRIDRYLLEEDELTLIETKSHIFGRVPINICPANDERKSGFHDIIPLVNAYNLVNSSLCSEIEDHRNAYLVIEGATIEEEDLIKMKSMGIIQVPTGGKVTWLTKTINDTFVQNELNNIERKIYDMMDQVNFNENWASNTSSLALKNKLLNLENRISMREAYMEKMLKQRLRNFFTYLRIKEGKEFDYRDVAIKFTRNLPTDLQGLSDTVSKLRDLFSDESLISLFPWVESPGGELEKRRRERLEEETLDLDKLKFGGNDE